MENEINALLQAICDDYNAWCVARDSETRWTPDMLLVVDSPKYIKIWSPRIERDGTIKHTTIWGFLAAVDVPAKNVLRGDILKAATYKAPALKVKRPARGNVFTGYVVNWTGPVYCGTTAQAKNELMADMAKPVDELTEI